MSQMDPDEAPKINAFEPNSALPLLPIWALLGHDETIRSHGVAPTLSAIMFSIVIV